MIFMKVENGMPNGVELELGNIQTPTQELIDEQSFYKVVDVTVYDDQTEDISNPSYSLNGTEVHKVFGVTPKTLDTVKYNQIQSILLSFNEKIHLGYPSQSIHMVVDIVNLNALDLLVRNAINTNQTSLHIEDYDNQAHNVSVVNATTMVKELCGYYQSQVDYKLNKYTQIHNATTNQAILNINWN
ncbi:MAG: hypothetical protein DRJ15_10760 [Bacteroidetes bacterium]|nr:MAG: hypothetical protein DRJ15_10760 [Bacteroidota bacterium]